jgi:hypothetical protein
MRTALILFFTISSVSVSLGLNPEKSRIDWSGAKWIAYELLSDSMKVIPAIHGNGNSLGTKALKRSVVPMFRRKFVVPCEIDQATIYISGLGHYELKINGERVGDRFLAPGWTLYQKRELFNSFDISSLLKPGKNALGVIVGNGFYNINRERYRKLVVAYGYPKLIFKLEIKLKDGTRLHFVSDENCSVAPSPITFTSIYGGEDYDARLEQPGWDSPGFDDDKWEKPVVLTDGTEKLVAESDNPLKIMDEFGAQKRLISRTGQLVYDFGQNASGIISIKVKGNRGTIVRIKPDELLNSEGNVTQRSGGGPYELNYILRGEGEETWQPGFTYYGFRYAEVQITEPENTKTKTKLLEIKMLHTRNSSETVGSFSCSSSLFNKTFDLINWAIKSNLASVTTDCPHREKLGWLEQTYLIGPSIHYNFDIRKLYSKIVDDMMDSQTADGLIPDIAPEYVPFEHGFRDSPEWGSAAVIIPCQMYKWYNERQLLVKAYPMMKRYVEYLEKKSKGYILDYGLGDWYDLGPRFPGESQLTPKALTATAIFYYDLKIMAKVAGLLENSADEVRFKNLSEKVQTAFLVKFFNPQTGVCSTGSQTAYAMPLYTGLIPEKNRKIVLENLTDSIAANGYALTAGDIGYHFLVRVLSENNLSEVLYLMNNRTDRPGYGYQLERGATSLTESWAALPEPSNNHMMLGHLMEWFYSGIGGIYQEENSSAYEKIIIAPKPVGDITWAKCSYKSVKGIISTDWKTEKNRFGLRVTIPEKSDGTVILPGKWKKGKIQINGNTSSDKILNKNGEIKLPAGSYHIVSKL